MQMDDSATTGAVVDLSPFEVVVRSTLLVARKEQDQQRPPPSAICHDHTAPAAASTSEPTKTLSDDRVAAVGGRPDSRDQTTFELRIRCRQVIEQLTTTTNSTASSLIDSPSPTTTPCRVKDSRVCVEHNHFINGTNMTPSVVQGQSVLTTLNVKDDQATPKWSSYGVSSIEPVKTSDMASTSPSYNKVWLNLQPNDLPPPTKYLTRRFLTHMILDFYWTTDSCSSLYDQLVQQQQQQQQQQLHTQTISDIHNNATTQTSSATQEQSLETLVMQTGLDKILIILSRDQNQPLIFSPIRIRWFVGVMQDNKRIVDSLMGVYRNASCPETRDSMDQSIQRMRRQFPSILQGNRHLLLETALEAQTNTIVVAGPNLRRRLRSRRVVATSAEGGTRPRVRRDDISGRDTDVEMNDNVWASTNMALPFVDKIDDNDNDNDTGKSSDNNNNHDNDDAREPSPRQPQQRRMGIGTNGKQLGIGLHNVLGGQQDGASAREEPHLEHLDSYSFNKLSPNNSNNRRPTDALVPDSSVQFNTATATSTAGVGEGNAQKFGAVFGDADLPRHMDMSSFDDEWSSTHTSPLHRQQQQQRGLSNSPPQMPPSDFSDFFHSSSSEEQHFES